MECPFCNRNSMMEEVPLNGTIERCKRWIYKNKHCYAVLKPEQHTIGECIVILRRHKKDITDNISIEEMSDFIKTINLIAKSIKNIAHNERGEKPERIYVGILCDGTGTEHLHAHLIPRYPFTEDDETKYKEYFIQRDGEIEILKKIKRKDLGGYWYIFDKEQTFYKSQFGQKPKKKKVEFLEELADKLRNSVSNDKEII